MGYSPRWYGPNANPIPEAREAMIPQGLRLHNSLLYQLSQKDKTATLFTDLEIPIISERASVRIYGYGAEYFQWSPESMSRRGITSDHQKGADRRGYIPSDPSALAGGECWMEA